MAKVDPSKKYMSPHARQNSTGRDMLKTGFFGAVDYALHLGSSFSAAWPSGLCHRLQVKLAMRIDQIKNLHYILGG